MSLPAPSAACPSEALEPPSTLPAVAATCRPSTPWLRNAWASVHSGVEWAFGLLSLLAGLAVLAVIPGLNLLAFGYLLEAGGRVARHGLLRRGFVGVRKAAVAGRVLLGTGLVLLPVRFLWGLARDARLVDPEGISARNWRSAAVVATGLAAAQIAWACCRGGRLRHFLWPAPLRFLRWLASAPSPLALARGAGAYLASLRLPAYFLLGLRGFCVTGLWLLPSAALLFLAARTAPAQGGGGLSLLGGAVLLGTVLYLPFLQVWLSVRDDWAAGFDVRSVRSLFGQAPCAFALALLLTCASALPLYLLKIELPPREIAWLPSLLFVGFIWPARLVTGWAVGRALRHPQPRHGLLRWTARMAMALVACAYVLVVYLTQYLSWNGTLSLLEQHAFLVPGPVLGP